ncbi:unnamed protein product [Paramecium sonneborni]|uniref:Uncharacterized protein n=1 Tax=Paramecium sonneborni TaxID=65129 RepID=A0A8S1M2A8_9CILI|nr:unnamed protein product [Paramecium sonneborni]
MAMLFWIKIKIQDNQLYCMKIWDHSINNQRYTKTTMSFTSISFNYYSKIYKTIIHRQDYNQTYFEE